MWHIEKCVYLIEWMCLIKLLLYTNVCLPQKLQRVKFMTMRIFSLISNELLWTFYQIIVYTSIINAILECISFVNIYLASFVHLSLCRTKKNPFKFIRIGPLLDKCSQQTPFSIWILVKWCVQNVFHFKWQILKTIFHKIPILCV